MLIRRLKKSLAKIGLGKSAEQKDIDGTGWNCEPHRNDGESGRPRESISIED
jgi:hypothetical protein